MSATLDFQLSKTPLRIGDTLQAPSSDHYNVYYVGAKAVFVERDILVRDTTGWFKPFGCCFESVEIAGLRQGERIKREGHSGEFVVKKVIHDEGTIIVTEHIELSDLAGWTIVRPG